MYSKQGVLTSDSIVKRLLGEVAGLIGRVEDFVVEDGKVQGKTKANWVSRSKIRCGNFRCSFVGFQRLIGRDLTLVAQGKLGEVSVVVTLPMSRF